MISAFGLVAVHTRNFPFPSYKLESKWPQNPQKSEDISLLSYLDIRKKIFNFQSFHLNFILFN